LSDRLCSQKLPQTLSLRFAANWVMLGRGLGAAPRMCTVWKPGVVCCLGVSVGLTYPLVALAAVLCCCRCCCAR
jgi:hypothetical protein